MPMPLTALNHSKNEATHPFPAILPDWYHFVYLQAATPQETAAIT
jgi:hypothetical protein